MRYNIFPFNTLTYDFTKELRSLFKIFDLHDLHLLKDKEYKELFKVSEDSITIFHTQFYDKYRAGWKEMVDLYERFIENVIAPMQTEDFLYQKFPTFRVHLPGNIAVGAFHNDGQFGHPKGEINFIIPITNSDGTASVWVESEPGKEDFEPVVLREGELVMFNGNELTHGNKPNETFKTRVSMDFRILPISKYDEANSSESVTLKAKFKEGEYYKRFQKK